MPNREAKARKRARRILNITLARKGRTPAQIARKLRKAARWKLSKEN